MFEVREDEPGYAILVDPVSKEKNRYGKPIELIPVTEEPVSLRINHEDTIGTNPNRNKQHGFHFTADNCIGCHACESACSEKNDLPPHLAFRSVGYVESGAFPEYQRMNISMACNHCDDPVCLKGCPTRAYTKHPEYGAVIQDPEICFGCGYCTWVCPYNAPQLDPVAGRVEKCNMCVDRLEVGLKPACVSACVGNALDFGVIENTPENKTHIDAAIPGFPSPKISNPNIRFQQNKNLGEEVTRTDSMPVKYKKDASGTFKPVVDQKKGQEKHWNLKRLSSSENPLVVFTLSVQTAVGLFAILTLGNYLGIDAFVTARASVMYLPAVLLSIALSAFGLLMSVTHLGKPMRFYRGFNNWRYSPVCREGLGIMFFMITLGLHVLCLLPSQSWMPEAVTMYLPATMISLLSTAADFFAPLSLIAGATGVYYMYRCYRIPARPFWNHTSTGTHFVGNAFSIGSLTAAIGFAPVVAYLGGDWISFTAILAGIALAGITIEGLGFIKQARELNNADHEGAASHYIQGTTFGKTYRARNALIVTNMITASLLATGLLPGSVQIILLGLLAAGILTTAIIGRALFYVLVVPTTMPGAFFWKNKAFQEHAIDLGMHHNPNSGVAPPRH